MGEEEMRLLQSSSSSLLIYKRFLLRSSGSGMAVVKEVEEEVPLMSMQDHSGMTGDGGKVHPARRREWSR